MPSQNREIVVYSLYREKGLTLALSGGSMRLSFSLRMKSAWYLLLVGLVFGSLGWHARADTPPSPAPVTPVHAKTFEIKDGEFMLDDKPFQIISGEMHYTRIPSAYWRHRLRMAKACGLNAVA